MTAFVNVSDNIEVSAVKYCGGSKLFRYYEQAIKDNGEANLKDLPSDNMPEDIKKAYQNAHGE